MCIIYCTTQAVLLPCGMASCPHCSREFAGDRVNSRHLAVCNPTGVAAVLPCLCGHQSTSLTQMKRHRKTCAVWQARDAKSLASERRAATNESVYGTANAAWTPDVRAQREATVRERYGVDNLFQSEDIKARARATMLDRYGAEHNSHVPEADAKRKATNLLRYGAENAFASDAVQEQIRATLRARYGVENPQQAPEVRRRTHATNLERYGVEEVLSAPTIRGRILGTNQEKYGGPAPSCSPAVNEKARQTNLERRGVPWTAMDPEVRRRQVETMEAHYGSHFFASEEGKATVRAALQERYGVDFPGAIDGHWDKVLTTFRERYGVDHPLQLAEFQEKQRNTNIRRYGTPFPGLRNRGMNHLEARLRALAPEHSLLFTGDGKWWRYLPDLQHHKNPDFIVPGPDPAHPKRGVTKIVEAFGDFWHSRMFTGKAPFDHEQELIAAYAAIGLDCLIIWESEVKHDPETVRARLCAFIGVQEVP